VLNPLSNEMIRGTSATLKVHNGQGVSLISFVNRSIVIPFDKSLDKKVCSQKLSIDYLVINRYSPYRVFDFFKPRMVIIDSSVSKHALAEIMRKCRQEGIPCYITSAQGAFVLNANDA
jgi:hypothetical protein